MIDPERRNSMEFAMPKFGHRKLSALLATLLGSEYALQDVLVWAWKFTGLAPMPENIATQILTFGAVLVFYFVNEEQAQ